jgi:ABC-type phosphate/phosphonate transport system substrate-binding protein
MNIISKLIILGLAVFLVGCGGGARVEPTIMSVAGVPTTVPTPFSTPLPYLPTPIPAGDADNPLRWVVVPRDREVATAQESTLEQELLQISGVNIDLVFADNMAEVINAVCNSDEGVVSAGWVDPIGYAIVRGRGCGSVLLGGQRDGETTTSGVIVIADSSTATTFGSLTDQTFCRLSPTDYDTWILPSLQMNAQGVSTSSFAEIRDFVNMNDILNAVAVGNCAATGMNAETFDTYIEAGERNADDLRSIQRSVSLPIGLLVVPLEFPLGNRERLLERLTSLVVDETSAESTPETAQGGSSQEAFVAVFGADSFVSMDEDTREIEQMNTFLNSTRIDFADIGN